MVFSVVMLCYAMKPMYGFIVLTQFHIFLRHVLLWNGEKYSENEHRRPLQHMHGKCKKGQAEGHSVSQNMKNKVFSLI